MADVLEGRLPSRLSLPPGSEPALHDAPPVLLPGTSNDAPPFSSVLAAEPGDRREVILP